MNNPALDAFWRPFRPNRQFKAGPGPVVLAQGLNGRTADGRDGVEGSSDLWCEGAGVVSIRNIGLAAGIELAPTPGAPGQRGNATQVAAFDRGLRTRAPGDTLVLAPPFTSTPQDIDRMVDLLRAAIQATESSPA